MRKPLHLTLPHRASRVVDRMMRAGSVASPEEAVEVALLEHARREGLIEESEAIEALRREAGRRPLSDGALEAAVQEVTRARGP